MKRLYKTGGLALTAILLAACSTGESVDLGDAGADTGSETGDSGETSEGDSAPAGGELIAAIGGEPDQFDPQSTSSYFSFQVLENVFDTLVEPDENLEMQPALATEWEISEDQLTYTFQLRDDVTWHDGSDFTAADVEYSFNRIIDEELANAWRFGGVESVTATGDYEVEFVVSAPSPNLLSNLGGFKGVAIVQEENVTSGAITQNPVGTGPFSFADYAAGDYVTLEANADYWGGAPGVDSVRYRFIPEPTTALADLQAGEIHWTSNIPAQQVESLSGNDDLVVGTAPSNDYWYLAINEANEPFNDERVRQAIAYAIDRDAIAQVTQYGNATVNQLAIPETSFWYSEYDKYSFDPAKAQELMDEAGVSNVEIDFMATSEYPETVTAGQLIASQLAEIGITLKIRELDFGTWLTEQADGNYDMFMLGWLGNIDPDDFYYAQHHSEGTSNFQSFSDEQVDEWLDAGRVETDENKRKEYYDQAAERIADLASYIYLYNPDVIQAWSPNVEGYETRSDAAVRFRDVTLAD